MEFGLSGAIQLARRSQTGFWPVADRFEIARDSLNLVTDQFASGLWPADELLASWIAPDRPNSITLSSSLAGRIPAHEAASGLDTIMKIGLN